MLRRLLLNCGILSSLLFGAMILFIRYDGYNPISQVPSELTAEGAPTRELWAILGVIYNSAILVFALGVWISARQRRLIKAIALLLLAIGMYVILWPFATMHQRETLQSGGATFADTLHLILGVSEPLIMMTIIGIGIAIFDRSFRIFSLAMLVLMAVTGAFVGIDSPKLQTGEPTPYIGLNERLAISAFLIWVIVFAVLMLREPES